MKTHVVYVYRAPRSDPDQEVEIKTDVMPCEPELALSLIHAEGQTFSLGSEYPGTYGDPPRNYKVVKRYLEAGTKNKLNVIVTDPDSKQPSYRDGALASARAPVQPEPRESPETASESEGKTEKTSPHTEQRSWWQRWFGG